MSADTYKVRVSTDRGGTWSDPVEVAGSEGVKELIKQVHTEHAWCAFSIEPALPEDITESIEP